MKITRNNAQRACDFQTALLENQYLAAQKCTIELFIDTKGKHLPSF